MTTENPSSDATSDPDWATYADTLKRSDLSKRNTRKVLATGTPAVLKKRSEDESDNWADYVDRLYIDRLMLTFNQ